MKLPTHSLRVHRFQLAAVALTVAFGARAQMIDEVPFITSPDNVTLEMLRLARVGPGDHVIDLGSGDGRIVITAAKRFGATGLGVEIVPELVEKSLRTARDAGLADKVSFRVQDLFQTDLKPASVITMYLLPDVNLKLRPELLKLEPGTRVVSHDWDMGDWKPDQTTVVSVPDKKVGLEKSSKVHLWIVPARVEGLWCGTGTAAPWQLQLKQRYQAVEGKLARGQAVQPVQGRLAGATLNLQRKGSLALSGEVLRATAGVGHGVPKDAAFKRAVGGRCA